MKGDQDQMLLDFWARLSNGNDNTKRYIGTNE
jgi:hypothetical protein